MYRYRELATQTILEYYGHRWTSVKAIDRILALIALTYLYCIRASGTFQRLGLGLKNVRKSTKRKKIIMICKAAVCGILIEDVFFKFKAL